MNVLVDKKLREDKNFWSGILFSLIGICQCKTLRNQKFIKMKTLQFVSLLALTLLTISCSDVPGVFNVKSVPLVQFGDHIIEMSSEYSAAPGPWSSFVALGSPDTYPDYGDIQTAWASKTADGKDEFLTIAYDTAQTVNNISIYETFNPGAVTEVSIRNKSNGFWISVYSGEADLHLPKKSRIMEISFPTTQFLVDAVKIAVSSNKVAGWNEIDAVSISGFYEDK